MGVAAVSSSAGGVGIGGDGGEGQQQEEWEHPSLEKREWLSVYIPQPSSHLSREDSVSDNPADAAVFVSIWRARFL